MEVTPAHLTMSQAIRYDRNIAEGRTPEEAMADATEGWDLLELADGYAVWISPAGSQLKGRLGR